MVSVTTESIESLVSSCCDLLEKSYLCGISNNFQPKNQNYHVVVICLKSLTFVVSVTTTKYINLSLICCDLLEKSYLCGISNNVCSLYALLGDVVICLKSLTFVVSVTTQR